MRVGVSDTAPGYPIPQEADAEALHGRGLQIVSTLADGWGIEVHKGQLGKTVWFSAPLPGWSSYSHQEEAPAKPADTARETLTSWAPGVRAVLDGLRDAVVATDVHGEVLYANAAAEELTRLAARVPHRALGPRHRPRLADRSLPGRLRDLRASHRPEDLARRNACRRSSSVPTGREVDTELVLSVFEHPRGRSGSSSASSGPATTGVCSAGPSSPPSCSRSSPMRRPTTRRPNGSSPPSGGGSTGTSRPSGPSPRRTSWCAGTCGRARPRSPRPSPKEKAADPTSGSEGLPRWVIEHGEPMWVSDLRHDSRFRTDALVHDGLQSAYAFPDPLPGRLRGRREDAQPPRARAATPPSSSSWTRSATTSANCCTPRPRRTSASNWWKSCSRPAGATSSCSWRPRCFPR